LKANFKISKSSHSENKKQSNDDEKPTKEISKEEFEDFMVKSGASGSFMVFRSDKKDDELGLDEL